jgi:pyruvate dehydrogenase E2 component (dihydrolipoamide acetyltransferase)
MHSTDRDIAPVTVPKWGLSMEEGAIVEWHVTAGKEVEQGQDLLDIETSKITNSVEAAASGVLRRIVEQAGTSVYVGQLVGVIAAESVSDADIDNFIDEFRKNYVPPDAQDGEQSKPTYVDIGNQRIHYLAVASEEEPRCATVLIHGFGGDCNNWMFNLVALADRQSVYAVDLPGHGSSGKTVDDSSLGGLATTVVAFIDAMGLSSVHLVGHSLGAGVAMKIAEMHPHKVSSLALIAPSGLGEQINAAYIHDFIEGKSRRELKNTLSMLFADKSLVTREMVDNALKYKRIDGVTETLRQIADEVFPQGRQKDSFRKLLDSLSPMPITVIWGEQDEITDPAQLAGLHDRIGTHLIAGVGHMPHMESASKVNDLLLSHLLHWRS